MEKTNFILNTKTEMKRTSVPENLMIQRLYDGTLNM